MQLCCLSKSNSQIPGRVIFSKCRAGYCQLTFPPFRICAKKLQKLPMVFKDKVPYCGPRGLLCLSLPQISSCTLIFLTIWASATFKILIVPANCSYDLGCRYSFMLISNTRHLHILILLSFLAVTICIVMCLFSWEFGWHLYSQLECKFHTSRDCLFLYLWDTAQCLVHNIQPINTC